MNSPAVGLKIRQRRKQIRITQASLAKEIGISASYLNLIEANKRSVGGKLLHRIAGILDMEVEDLSGAHERRISDDLREIPSEPLLHHLGLDPRQADALVAQHPEWARAILVLYRAYLDNNHMISALSDRLSKDPILQKSVHQMLTHITTIRSTAEILHDEPGLDDRENRRFFRTLNTESIALSDAAQKLVSFLDQQHVGKESLSPAEQVDDFIIGNRNWFPNLEQVAGELLKELDALERHNIDGALEEYLEVNFNITIRHPSTTDRLPERDSCEFTPHTPAGHINISPGLEPTTRRFQLARIVVQQAHGDILTQLCDDQRLSTKTARDRAFNALSSYTAAALLMPYTRFLELARACRYDVERLCREFQVSFEQACHRLVSLRDPKNEGIPFALLRSDPSGYITKRFPLYGFPLPRYGHGCPLWTVFSAFQHPGTIVRQLAEFPGGGKFLMLARSITKPVNRFHQQPIRHALLLACDLLHADKTIYSDNMNLTEGIIDPVGPGCRLCNRVSCRHRQEAHIIGDSPFN